MTFRRHSAAGGFTILEILIAVAILVVGMLGILALFPFAIESGRHSIEDTNAVLIANSVEQSIREGLQNRKGQSPDGKWTYFIFDHDGVRDPLPKDVSDADPSKDYYILLPDQDTDGTRTSMPRDQAYNEGKLFVYPETDGKSWTVNELGIEKEYTEQQFEDPNNPNRFHASNAPPNGGGNPLNADDDKTNSTVMLPDGSSYSTYQVMNVYRLGDPLRRPDQEEQPGASKDPLSTYSYAFTIRRALNDASLDQNPPSTKGGEDVVPAGELYEVEILVFRAFSPLTANGQPIYQTRILVQK